MKKNPIRNMIMVFIWYNL